MNRQMTGKLVSAAVIILAAITLGVLLFQISSTLNDPDSPWIGFMGFAVPVLLAFPHILSLFISEPPAFRGVHTVITFLSGCAFAVLAGIDHSAPSYQYWIAVPFFSTLIVAASRCVGILDSWRRLKRTSFRWVFLLFLIWFYGLYAGWMTRVHPVTGDEPHYLLMAHSLIYDGDLNLYDEYQNLEYSPFYSAPLIPKPSDYVTRGIIESRGLGATFSIALLPGYLLAGYPGAVATQVLFTSALVFFAYLFFKEVTGRERVSFAVAIIMGSLPPVITYSSYIYPDTLGALLFIMGLRYLYRSQREPGRRVYSNLNIIAACTFMILLKFRFLPLISLLVIGMFSLMRRRTVKLLLFSIALIFIAAIYLSLDFFVFQGNLFANRFGTLIKFSSFLPDSRSIAALLGTLLDQEAGLLFFCPVGILLLVGIKKWSGRRGLLFWMTAMSLPVTIISLIGHFGWHSLPTPSLRYLLPALPAFFIFLIPLLHHRRSLTLPQQVSLRVFLAASLAVSVLLSINPDWQVNFADGTSEFFTSMSQSLKIPATSFLPSLTRPNWVVIPWLLGMSGFIIWLCRNGSRAPRQRAVYTHVTALLALLGMAFVSGVQHAPLHVIHAEDNYLSKPRGGHVFPFPKDPFFHNQRVYGWTLFNGDSLSPGFNLGNQKYNLHIRARLMGQPFTCNLVVRNGQEPVSTITINDKTWQDLVIPLRITEAAGDNLQLIVKGHLHQSVVVDKIEVLGTNPFRQWMLGAIRESARKLNLPKLEFWASKQFFMSHPGDPWNAFQRAVPNSWPQTTALPESSEYPIENARVERTLELSRLLGLKAMIQLEELFSFSFQETITDPEMADYILAEIAAGRGYSAYRVLEEYLLTQPERLDIQLAQTVYHFLRGQFSESAELIADILLASKAEKITLTRPDLGRQFAPELAPHLEAMRDNESYQQCVQIILTRKLRECIQQYHAGELDLAFRSFSELYLLDRGFFIENIPKHDRNFIALMASNMSYIQTEDALLLSNDYLQDKQIKPAFAFAELAVRLDPAHPQARVVLARVLFHYHRVNESYHQCITASALKFNDDNIRTLLTVIDKGKEQRSRYFGFIPDTDH